MQCHRVCTKARPTSSKLGCHFKSFGPKRTFVQLECYITANAIPEFNYVENDMLMQAEADLLDMVALHHMPNDMPPRLAPLQVEGDGNCFPHTISYLLFKTENHHTEIWYT